MHRTRSLTGLALTLTALAWAPHARGQGSAADYERAAALPSHVRGKVLNTAVRPEWLSPTAFWYRTTLAEGRRKYWRVDAESGTKAPLFDHAAIAERLAKAVGRAVEADRLPIERLDAHTAGSFVMMIQNDGRIWKLDPATSELAELPATERTPFHLPPKGGPIVSRDGTRNTSITFVNNTGESVKMFWIDSGGVRKPYDRMGPGQTATQNTYAGHAWVAVGHDGKDLAFFEAVGRPSIAVIESTPREQDRKPPQVDAEDEDGLAWGSEAAAPPATQPETKPSKTDFFVKEYNVFAKNTETGEAVQLSTDGTAEDAYDGRLYPSPDGSRLVAMKTKRGGDRKVVYIESSPSSRVQPITHEYEYLKPGDAIPLSKPRLFDVAGRSPVAVDDGLFPNPWAIDDLKWDADGSRFSFVYNQRGHTVMRVVAVGSDGRASAIVDEQCKTFFDYAAKTYFKRLDGTGELLWMSERDGWNHLYLYDAKTGAIKNQITKGEWVVRRVDRVDEGKRQIYFRAMGIRPGQDPYHVHFARVNFDGTGLTVLTEGDGTHELVASPSGKYFIDTYSRADLPPVTELRRTADGSLVVELERADWSPLVAAGWKAPERFAAKGRDGKTDIYGLIHRPTNFDPAKKYPVVEAIYAGPHDQHVPKGFRDYSQCLEIAELGFIVVQIDGMGTNWRSKAFHDVAWKNLRDAGFPDRIAWMNAAAAKHPEMDLVNGGRGVGIYGGSAGGQNSTAALLWHGDFYKTAVSDCGCHDNRMDKVWWNELWMSWPIGPHYEENSNVVNANRLPGDCHLLLTVGEMDENVDPASTMQVVNALVKANKDFDLLVLPGMGHGAAESPYGRRRRQDYLVRHVMGREPRWTSTGPASTTTTPSAP